MRTAADRGEASLLRLALDELPESILVVDPGGHTVFCNRAARSVHSMSADMGPPCPAPHGDCSGPRDRPLPCVLRDAVSSGDAQRARGEHRQDANDGRIPQLTAVPLRAPDGAHVGVVHVARDITERARHERAIARARNESQSTADAVPDLIILVDSEERVLRCNHAVSAFMGCDYSKLVGRRIPDLFAGHCDPHELAVTHGEVHWTEPRALFDLSRYPVTLEDGPGAVWILREITALRRLESIAASVDMMNNVGHVLSGVRHELGNPVNALKTALTVLQDHLDTFSPEKRLEYVRRCLDDVARIQVLLEQLRTFNGSECVAPTTVEVLPLIAGIVALAREQVEERGIRLECVLPERPDALACADVRALQQVVLGLVANALDALAGRADPWLRLEANVDASRVTIMVEDNGGGIADCDIDLVFLPLFTTKPRGTGLGLAIARNLISRMNGTIDLRSRRGEGTVVEISLPRVPERKPSASRQGSASGAATEWKRSATT